MGTPSNNELTGQVSAPTLERVLSLVDVSVDGCWRWKGRNNGKGNPQLAHDGTVLTGARAAWLAVNGSIPAHCWICRTCDEPACVAPLHHRALTPAEWIATKASKRRERAKLDVDKVRRIKALIQEGIYRPTIAKDFGVGRQTIEDIHSEATWRDVPWP